jgi:hypothetical protein
MAKPIPLPISTEYLPKEVGDLRKEVELLPRSARDRLLPLCDKICRFMYLQGRLFELAQENLDRLQIEMKCVQFDLDCTRQERDELQEELENHTEGW